MREYASIYIDRFNFSVTPVNAKVPFINGWQKIHGDSILADRYDYDWLKATGIGLLTGEPSGIVCLDIDILPTHTHLLPVLEELNKLLPPLLLGKVGNPLKQPARFYNFNNLKSRKWPYLKVELLSTGNQSLLPPSNHPDTGNPYVWAGKKISQIDMDLLPDLPQEVMKPATGRCNHQSHNHISSFAVAKFREGITKSDLHRAVLAYDKKINENISYFVCPSRKWRSRDALQNAVTFIEEIFNNPSLKDQHALDKKKPVETTIDQLDFSWVNDNGKKCPSSKFEDFETLFNTMFPTARKDYFNGTVFYKDKKEWKPVENEIRLIRAEARIHGLTVQHTEDNLYKWISALKPKLLIDIPAWDKTDHISELLKYVEVTNISHDHFEDLFKTWMAGIFKRVYQPEFHNQCVIFKGDQGIGKDMLIGKIFKSLEGYYSEISISSRQRDNYESIEPLIVSYLPEFDESSRTPISTIKAFISASKATYRGAYDRKASAHIFRHSVVSSANIDNILRDSTGNRRFWIFELSKIDWKYNDVINSGQLISQAFALYKEKYKSQPGALEAMKEYTKEETPLSSDELFMEEFHDYLVELYKLLQGYNDGGGYASGELKALRAEYQENKEKIRWYMISDGVWRISKKYKLAMKTAQSVIKRKGYCARDKKNSYYFIPTVDGNHTPMYVTRADSNVIKIK
jgi:hypothetical protein